MSKCWDCKHINKTIHMKLENDILYNVWCKVGDMEDKNCLKFEKFKDKSMKKEYKLCKNI